MMRRSDQSDRTGRESNRRGRLDLIAPGDASRKRTSASRGASVVSRDDASPEAVHDLLTNAQLAVRWQLSRGTLANQRYDTINDPERHTQPGHLLQVMWSGPFQLLLAKLGQRM
jgi:hypothetical protein